MDKSIIKKIQKLLKLSKCKTGNVNEAAAAAAKATRLMAEHKISTADVLSVAESLDENPIVQGVIDSNKRLIPWKLKLLDALVYTNSAALLIQDVKHPSLGVYKDGRPKTESFYTVLGQESDVKAVQYLYAAYSATIIRLQKQWSASKYRKPSRKELLSFRTGAAVTISDRIRQAYAETRRGAASKYALVKIDTIKKRIDEMINDANPENVEAPKFDGDAIAFWEGQAAGLDVPIAGRASLNPKREVLPR